MGTGNLQYTPDSPAYQLANKSYNMYNIESPAYV